MRDSPVSVSAPLRKLNAVCVLCHLKILLNYARGLFFGILRFRNIGLSEHWAVPLEKPPLFKVGNDRKSLRTTAVFEDGES